MSQTIFSGNKLDTFRILTGAVAGERKGQTAGGLKIAPKHDVTEREGGHLWKQM